MKPLTLILCLIAILGSAASTFFYFQIGSASEQLQQDAALTATKTTELQTKLNEAAVQGEVLQKRLAELDSELGEAKTKASAADARSTQLGRETSQLRNQLAAKTESAQALAAEISQLKRELSEIKLSTSTAAAEQSESDKTTIAVLQARITDLLAAANKASVRTGKPKPGVKAGAALAGDGVLPARAADGANYQVVSIGANNAFVVINAGSAQGIVDKQNLVISRNGNALAEAVISSCQENYSIAQIVTRSLMGGLSKGDLATFEQ